jgi:large subunit ribosomal protein L14e
VKFNTGEQKGKIAVIVEIIDATRVIVDGPLHGVKRQVINVKRLALTEFVVPIQRGSRTPKVLLASKEFDLAGKWSVSASSKAAVARASRTNMSDFDRFKAMVARKHRSHAIKTEVAKLKNKK